MLIAALMPVSISTTTPRTWRIWSMWVSCVPDLALLTTERLSNRRTRTCRAAQIEGVRTGGSHSLFAGRPYYSRLRPIACQKTLSICLLVWEDGFSAGGATVQPKVHFQCGVVRLADGTALCLSGRYGSDGVTGKRAEGKLLRPFCAASRQLENRDDAG